MYAHIYVYICVNTYIYMYIISIPREMMGYSMLFTSVQFTQPTTAVKQELVHGGPSIYI